MQNAEHTGEDMRTGLAQHCVSALARYGDRQKRLRPNCEVAQVVASPPAASAGDRVPDGARQGERAYVPRPLPTGERVPRRAVELSGKDGLVKVAPFSDTEKESGCWFHV